MLFYVELNLANIFYFFSSFTLSGSYFSMSISNLVEIPLVLVIVNLTVLIYFIIDAVKSIKFRGIIFVS